jgi:hypothetical protein
MAHPRLPSNVLLFPGTDPPSLPTAPDPSFRAFLDHIQERELVDAADCLGALLDLDEERAYHCTLHFLGHYRRDRTRAMGKIMRLRLEAHEGNLDTVLLLLRDCFGLVGQEAVALLAPLQELAHPA